MIYREVVKVIVKAGWREVRVNGSHHQFKHPGYAKLVSINEHRGKDLSPGVIDSIEKVTGLSLKKR